MVTLPVVKCSGLASCMRQKELIEDNVLRLIVLGLHENITILLLYYYILFLNSVYIQ